MVLEKDVCVVGCVVLCVKMRRFEEGGLVGVFRRLQVFLRQVRSSWELGSRGYGVFTGFVFFQVFLKYCAVGFLVLFFYLQRDEIRFFRVGIRVRIRYGIGVDFIREVVILFFVRLGFGYFSDKMWQSFSCKVIFLVQFLWAGQVVFVQFFFIFIVFRFFFLGGKGFLFCGSFFSIWVIFGGVRSLVLDTLIQRWV